jgi:hypothetical protein
MLAGLRHRNGFKTRPTLRREAGEKGPRDGDHQPVSLCSAALPFSVCEGASVFTSLGVRQLCLVLPACCAAPTNSCISEVAASPVVAGLFNCAQECAAETALCRSLRSDILSAAETVFIFCALPRVQLGLPLFPGRTSRRSRCRPQTVYFLAREYELSSQLTLGPYLPGPSAGAFRCKAPYGIVDAQPLLTSFGLAPTSTPFGAQ